MARPWCCFTASRPRSFLWRSIIPVLAGSGLHVIAPDLIGFGRSDKPADITDHSYARHVEWVRAALFDALNLRDLTFVGHDWGGLIGLRLLAEHGDQFSASSPPTPRCPPVTSRCPNFGCASGRP
jgi:haloalkane dehalogenase